MICHLCQQQFKRLSFSHIRLHFSSDEDTKAYLKNTGLTLFTAEESNRGSNLAGPISSAHWARIRADYLQDPTLCWNCKTPLTYIRRKKKFCNRSCAASYNNKHRTKEQLQTRNRAISKALKGRQLGFALLPIQLSTPTTNCLGIRKKQHFPKTRNRNLCICDDCGTSFYKRTSNKVLYCQKCRNSHMGGYHPNSTRVHRCSYKGQQMDSGAESGFAHLCDEYGIQWIKNTSTAFQFTDSAGKVRRYYPDFFLPDKGIWIEIKGKRYVRPDDHLRLQAVPQILLIMSHELRNHKKVIAQIEAMPTTTGPRGIEPR